MIPAEFGYVAPTTVEDALQALSDGGDNAKLLAGGHSLVPLMKLRFAQPGVLVDLGRVQGLKGIRRTDTGLSIGSMTTHAEIARSADVLALAPALSQAAGEIGDRQVRARGTIGGSLAHADPAADYPAVMLALGAEVVARSLSGERVIGADDFFTGLLETAVQPGELITEVRFPEMRRSAYEKFPNPASHYATTGVAVGLTGNGTVTSARVGVTGAAGSAFRAKAAEAVLEGNQLDADIVARAAEDAYGGEELLSDIHASAEYREVLIRVLTARALRRLLP